PRWSGCMAESELRIPVAAGGQVSALLTPSSGARWLYVFAHGAGGGMRHPVMHPAANALAGRGGARPSHNIPDMERKRRRPDDPAVAVQAVRAAVAAAAAALPGVPLLAGGKSFGGRMTSTAQAEQPLPGVRGLAFFGFPLHPPGRPAMTRAQHL